jgi:hypothetical protein
MRRLLQFTTVEDIKLCSYGFALQEFIKANNLTMNPDGRTFNQTILSPATTVVVPVIVQPEANSTSGVNSTNETSSNSTNTTSMTQPLEPQHIVTHKTKRIKLSLNASGNENLIYYYNRQ